jgi:flagellar export protein FliJ
MAVLRFRENIERREYVALERIQQEMAILQEQLRRIEQWRAMAVQRRETDLAEGVAAIHLQGDFEQELALERQRDALQVKRERLTLDQKQHLNSYKIARQKREVLDELRKRQFEAYAREQARRQQAVMDDLFLSRRKRNE